MSVKEIYAHFHKNLTNVTISNQTAEVLSLLRTANKPVDWTQAQLRSSPIKRHIFLIKHARKHNVFIPPECTTKGAFFRNSVGVMFAVTDSHQECRAGSRTSPPKCSS